MNIQWCDSPLRQPQLHRLIHLPTRPHRRLLALGHVRDLGVDVALLRNRYRRVPRHRLSVEDVGPAFDDRLSRVLSIWSRP